MTLNMYAVSVTVVATLALGMLYIELAPGVAADDGVTLESEGIVWVEDSSDTIYTLVALHEPSPERGWMTEWHDGFRLDAVGAARPLDLCALGARHPVLVLSDVGKKRGARPMDYMSREWVLSRPTNVQRAMLKIPPMALVAGTKPLLCPAPGEAAEVASYCVDDHGHVTVKVYGVVRAPATRPDMADELGFAMCEVEWLRVVEESPEYPLAELRQLLASVVS